MSYSGVNITQNFLKQVIGVHISIEFFKKKKHRKEAQAPNLDNM